MSSEFKHSKEHRKRKREYCNKYEKTKKGFVMRMYRNMKSRVEGVQKKKAHLYFGLELMDKSEFYNFALTSKQFNELFDAYENQDMIEN